MAKDSTNALLAKLVLQGLAADCSVSTELLHSAPGSNSASRRASVMDFVQRECMVEVKLKLKNNFGGAKCAHCVCKSN